MSFSRSFSTVGTVGRKGESGTPWLSVMNVFSGGVFVAAGFMHLLPEAQVGLRALSSEWKFEVSERAWRLSRINLNTEQRTLTRVGSKPTVATGFDLIFEDENVFTQ